MPEKPRNWTRNKETKKPRKQETIIGNKNHKQAVNHDLWVFVSAYARETKKPNKKPRNQETKKPRNQEIGQETKKPSNHKRTTKPIHKQTIIIYGCCFRLCLGPGPRKSKNGKTTQTQSGKKTHKQGSLRHIAT